MKKWLIGTAWLTLLFVLVNYIPAWRVSSSYHKLISTSAEQVLQQQDPLVIDVFAAQGSVAAQLVNNFLQPLVTQLPSVAVNYLDLKENPSLAGNRTVNAQGEMLIRQGTQEFHLKTLSYEAFFNGLKRFEQTATAWLVILDGWQGKSMGTSSQSGIGQWVADLRSLNYAVVTLSWQPQLRLPQDVKGLIIPAPKESISQEVVDWLQDQSQQGINLWWVTEPELAHSQPALSLMFDVMPLGSYHAGHLILKSLPPHQLNSRFDRPLDLVEVLPFETMAEPLWFDTTGQVVAATQQLSGQRLLVTGDGDFISNAHLYSGGNFEMSIRLVDWLLGYDDRVDLPSIGLQQSQIHLNQTQVLSFSGLMIILIPLLLVLIAVRAWFKHR